MKFKRREKRNSGTKKIIEKIRSIKKCATVDHDQSSYQPLRRIYTIFYCSFSRWWILTDLYRSSSFVEIIIKSTEWKTLFDTYRRTVLVHALTQTTRKGQEKQKWQNETLVTRIGRSMFESPNNNKGHKFNGLRLRTMASTFSFCLSNMARFT